MRRLNTDEENVDIENDIEEDLKKLVTAKDVNSSMKFLSLSQNSEREREQKVDGWISIPQFTTFHLDNHNDQKGKQILPKQAGELEG